jgi:hypothetical protein
MRWFGMALLLAALQEPEKKFVPTDQYEKRVHEGWTLYVNRALLGGAYAEVGRRALRLLEFKLEEVARLVPERPLSELRKVPIWLGVNDYLEDRACYHPSADWLRKNGLNPDKAKAVEIGSAATFLRHIRDQPMMVVHELAHAYHDRVLSFEHPGILEAYRKAKEAGLYEKVLRINGRRERAYAVKNHHEYFAEASEAYFGTNDFFPFVRPELKEHDPEVYAILEEVWGR